MSADDTLTLLSQRPATFRSPRRINWHVQNSFRFKRFRRLGCGFMARGLKPAAGHAVQYDSTPQSRYRANLEQIRRSRPDSGLGLSHFQYEHLENDSSCSLPARQRAGAAVRVRVSGPATGHAVGTYRIVPGANGFGSSVEGLWLGCLNLIKVDSRLHGKGNSKLPWRKAGQPSHPVDVVD